MNSFPDMVPSGKGADFIVVSGALWDMVVERLNVLCDPVAVPDSNVAQFFVSKSGFRLDLASVDSRLQALESFTGVSSINTIVETNANATIRAQILSILGTMTANTACVANVAVTTFTIP